MCIAGIFHPQIPAGRSGGSRRDGRSPIVGRTAAACGLLPASGLAIAVFDHRSDAVRPPMLTEDRKSRQL